MGRVGLFLDSRVDIKNYSESRLAASLILRNIDFISQVPLFLVFGI